MCFLYCKTDRLSGPWLLVLEALLAFALPAGSLALTNPSPTVLVAGNSNDFTLFLFCFLGFGLTAAVT